MTHHSSAIQVLPRYVLGGALATLGWKDGYLDETPPPWW